ncbi:bifunctional metallophosphatase/5'-nucleotidase [Blastochloris viridis]|uniref:5'-nucleotidase n=1 Tax=Blastochloris viridis TaxID=1079 RepID=A0A0H5BEU3_BLAVI|nr:5'-nucleotidase C-terminal domain-containing protein [Blastochloris viridis]ALK09383.1 Trifunctional nucleotide phosphoesterase protein YfkN precursor [Blastochloris viridis]BAS00738.1 5'-nucleotidase [Blastochloris viridis]CUU42046.1 Trifunctional nucleotide phosphoesterase proteinYfkN precursor [Blastochloris viridis]
MRLIAALFIATLSWSALFSSVAAARTARVTLLLICDMYNLSAQDGRGGYAKVAGVVAAERASGRNVIVAHAGDAFSPTLLSGFDKAENVIDLLNAIKPDVFVPGNHEYDFGPEVFRQRIGQAEFPVVAANLRDKDGRPLEGIADSRVFEFDGVKVAVVGLTATDSPQKSQPGDLRFRDSVETLREQSNALRENGADIVVALAHANRAIDFQLYASRATDVLLSGDDHDLWVQYDGAVAAAEAKQNGEYVIAIDLDVQIEDGARRKVTWWPDFRIIDTKTAADEPRVAEMVKGFEADLSQEFDVTLAKVGAPFDSLNATVRSGEAAIGNLFADAIRNSTGADVALINGGGLRGNRAYGVDSEVSRRDVLKELPFSNKTVVLEVTGAQLRAALENGLSKLGTASGRFPQVSGLTLTVSRSRPAGERITAIAVDGAPLDDAARYTLATIDFLMNGGDGYDMLKAAKPLAGERDGQLMANDVMVYLRSLGTLAPKVEGRIAVRE